MNGLTQQHYDASGFDDDLEGIAGGAKAADAPTGPGRHPPGKFPGVVEEIIQKDWQGQPIWNFKIRTDVGVAEYALFGWKAGEVAAAKAQAQVGNVEALQRVQSTMARHKRLFVDLGLAEPEGWAKGPNSILARLGELIGCACEVVVQPDRRDATKTRVFINAPVANAAGVYYDPSHGPGGGLPDFSAPGTPSLDDIPF